MEATPTHFFKVILASTIEDKKLSIPQKFARKFGDELSAVATLTVPSGYTWRVGLTKDEGKIWFHNGWHEFVEYHSICVGYFVVFQYRKKSNFQVHILDTTACQIQYIRKNMCTLSSNIIRKCTANIGSSKFKNGYEMQGKKRRMEQVEVKDESDNANDSMQGKLKIIGMSNSQGSVRCKTRLSETPCALAQEPYLFADNTKLKEHRADVVDGDELIALLENLGTCMCSSKSFSVEERQRAINAAKFFKPKNPSFLVVVRDRNILKRYVYVPLAFSRKCLSGDKLFIVQDSDGTELDVKTYGTRNCILSGWAGFFEENDVKEGDILFFELIKMKDLRLKVSVFHA